MAILFSGDAFNAFVNSHRLDQRSSRKVTKNEKKYLKEVKKAVEVGL